jgi:hypothetical protein
MQGMTVKKEKPIKNDLDRVIGFNEFGILWQI